MIKINMLPYREMLQKARVNKQLVIAAVILVCVFAGIGIVHSALKGQIKEREEKVAQLTKSIAEKEKIKRQIEDFKKKKADLKRKTDVVEKLASNRALLVHLFDEISMRIPQGRAWLTSMKTTGSELELKGIALTDEIIAQFMVKLEESPYLDSKGIALVQTKMITKEGIKLKEFNLKCRISPPKITLDDESKTDKEG